MRFSEAERTAIELWLTKATLYVNAVDPLQVLCGAVRYCTLLPGSSALMRYVTAGSLWHEWRGWASLQLDLGPENKMIVRIE